MLGDAAHLMSPFGGEGVNLALADAADLVEALVSPKGWAAVAAYEAAMVARAIPAAEGSAEGLAVTLSSNGVDSVLAHYRERVEGSRVTPSPASAGEGFPQVGSTIPIPIIRNAVMLGTKK